MITKEQAMNLTHGDTLYHSYYTNADGSPMRFRVTGKCKVWKTRPDEFRVPLKHGLYDYDEVTDITAEYFFLEEEEAAK